MVSQTVKVTNEMGIHMRPANILVTAMTKYSSNIDIIYKEKKINGKSIMNVMAACITNGSEITVICDGTDENEMLKEAVSIIESGFGE
ncbi:MAG: HPr family phosphocarrier protein [Clostridiales bacterium]|nr:HPr family phosphocarrier protein [Clostridiales bacterium]